MCFTWYSSCNTDSDNTDSDPFTPVLILPLNGEALDNGCYDKSDLITWVFDWEDCAGATKYHLYVKHLGSRFPLLDDEVINSEFTYSDYAYVANKNLSNWNWKVRAMIDGVWGPWSIERSFRVVEPDTDCNP